MALPPTHRARTRTDRPPRTGAPPPPRRLAQPPPEARPLVFPLNPVLVAIERLLCLERELACDDGVLRRTCAPRLYATCLANLAERGIDHRAFSLALGALGNAARRSELGRRIQRILRRQTDASPVQTRALTAAVCLVLVGGATILARCPLLVSFVPAQPAIASAARTNPPPAQPMQVAYTAAESAPRLMTASLTLVSKRRSTRLRLRKPIPMQLARPPKQPDRSLLLTAWPEQERPHFLTLGSSLHEAGYFAIVHVEGGWVLLQL